MLVPSLHVTTHPVDVAATCARVAVDDALRATDALAVDGSVTSDARIVPGPMAVPRCQTTSAVDPAPAAIAGNVSTAPPVALFVT